MSSGNDSEVHAFIGIPKSSSKSQDDFNMQKLNLEGKDFCAAKTLYISGFYLFLIQTSGTRNRYLRASRSM